MKNRSLSLRSFANSLSYGDRIHPTRDWLLLLGVTGVLLLVSVAWSIYLFTELENGKAIGASSVTAQKVVAPSVTQAQDIFKERAIEEGNYQNQYHFVDPSVPSS